MKRNLAMWGECPPAPGVSSAPSPKTNDFVSNTSTTLPASPYPIGSPGIPWGAAEKAAWLARQHVRRSYADDVVVPLRNHLPASAKLLQYGETDYTHLGLRSYLLYAVRSRVWQPDRPVVLVTGGVHGYETSGVQGALRWIAQEFDRHADVVNLLILPCISPWAYESINRWNPDGLDPNRHFKPGSPVAECALAMACVEASCAKVDLHVDLHETTDTDNSEFGPAKAARDAKPEPWHAIPDGFYLVGDADRPEPEFQRALIDAVRRVTHIAEPGADGCRVGASLQQPGVIHYAIRSLGLCNGMTAARFVTTTEVYPDSPGVSAKQCNQAQGVAVGAAIKFLRRG